MKLFIFAIFMAMASFCLNSSEAANILGLFPSPSKSHLLIHCAIADTLAQAGHNVTVLGTVPNIYPRAKYQYIHVQGAMYDNKFANDMVNKPAPAYVKFYQTMNSVTAMANATLNAPGMQEFLQTHKAGDFDVIIFGYFMNEFMLGIGAHFQCPIIVSFMVQPIFSLNNMIANPLELSYVPTLFSGGKQPLSFWDRLQNMFAVAVEEGILMNVLKQNFRKLYR